MQAVAPEGANAYIIDGEVSCREKGSVPVQFFKVKINEKQRVLRRDEVVGNLDLLLKINGINIS